MLLPEDIHPKNTLVFNGSLIIKALNKVGEATLLDLFVEARKENEMGMPLFVPSLDWLYLVDCVLIDDQGKISLCS